ncbi:hypothetical protein HYH02_000385 [Chlamydomonas schloesseri]|uniref:HTH La-type RNA-binding domain-containing protein n=1 Tax=Chlamydomonas schloesseri TaxID=2026947 RepID=A0A835WVK6_9CHLO|nr:hypothetical protein HYH02_000385 [Chlamydomonas schloesseri]|eukprot:KAG2454540.1 hypothetical protein HYH02_000385 [Chlamydomonas schloesseri]
MAEHKPASAAGSDAEVFLSASEDEAVQQEVTPELLSALVKQVEFYFSDANLPTDKKLLKQIRKDPDGFVPVKLFANFRKVRALSKDVAIITEALRNAKLLQLSEDGKRVKRLVPVPDYDIGDIQRRTIVVENLPAVSSPTIESVTDMFRMYGRVKLVRICSRESKGKLPSWLTSSCQNMQGQHAYVEFEDEEGAVLAAAALAQEYDAPDGAVQVRRLLACIAEHRERRSGAGASSFGGSSVQGGMNGSRKGSRDVSPNRPGAVGSRRNSNGGMSSGGATMTSYGGAYSSCGGASSHQSGWASMGGAAPTDFGHAHLHVPHHHHSYGGAYEHFGGSRRGSGGGAPSCGGAVLPPPPPPPRRSCDSAPASELLHSALVAPPPPPPPPPAPAPMAAPLPVPAPAAAPAPAQPPRLNIYRPPAKRLSDGVSGVPASAASPLIRSSGGSFTSAGGSSHCSASSSVAVSAVSTPTVASQLASPMVPPVAVSPPLASRPVAVSAGGKPPVPHAAAVHPAKPEPVAALPSNALAEAIAAAAAERRASEAGAKAAEAVTAAAPRAPLSVAVAVAPSAPKFVLDLPAATAAAPAPRRASPPGTVSGEAVVSPSGAPLAPKVLRSAAPIAGAVPVAAAAAPAARATQMVADVEGFINNILASSIPAPRAAANGGAAAVGAKPAIARKQPAPKQLTSSAQPQDAAAAVAGILASALRSKAPAAAAAPAAPVAAPAGPMIFLTAVMEGEDIAAADLEHAVTVNVHMPVAAAATKSAATTPAKGAAPAVPKYSPGAALRSSGGGLAAGSTSPVLAAAASISDGGAASSGHATPASAMVHVARGPDGSRGFGRRGPLVA